MTCRGRQMSPQRGICKPKSKPEWGDRLVQTFPGPWVDGALQREPKEHPVPLEEFGSSRCIVHLLSWFLLQAQTHQLMSRTVFRQKQLWATYWENGVWGVEGATQLGSGMPDKSKHTQEERVGGWASKNLSPIKGNINIINPVIMVYVSIFIRFPRAIITLNHKSALNYLIRGSPLGQEWITGTNLDNSLHTVQVTPRKLTSETSIRPKLLVRNVLFFYYCLQITSVEQMQLSDKSADTVFKGIAVLTCSWSLSVHLLLHHAGQLQYALGLFVWDKLQFALSSYHTLSRKGLCENLRGSNGCSMFPCAVDQDEVSWSVHDPETTTSVLKSKEAMNERQELDEAPV